MKPSDRLPTYLRIDDHNYHTKKEFLEDWEAGKVFSCTSFGWTDIKISKALAAELYKRRLRFIIIPLANSKDAIYEISKKDFIPTDNRYKEIM